LTAELPEQRGLSPERLAAGNRVTYAAVYQKGGLLGTVKLAPDRDYRGHVLLVCQAGMERTLREQLARQDVVVEYGTELVALAQAEPDEPDGPGVTALLRHRDGRLEDIAASYVNGADGMHGPTGDVLDLSAHVKPGRRPYVLADLRLDGDLRRDVISVFLGRCGFVMLPTRLPGSPCHALFHTSRIRVPCRTTLQRTIAELSQAQRQRYARYDTADPSARPARSARVTATSRACSVGFEPGTGVSMNRP
jgi:hypothetical protein